MRYVETAMASAVTISARLPFLCIYTKIENIYGGNGVAKRLYMTADAVAAVFIFGIKVRFLL